MKRAAYALTAIVACTVQLGDGERRTTARELTLDVIVPALDDVVTRAGDQLVAIRAFADAPDATTLEAARFAWRAARVPWKQTDAFRFGPAKDLSLAVAIDQTVEPDKIELELAGTATLDAAFVENLGANKKGFHAIEYVLFGDLATLTGDQRRRDLLVAYAANLETKARMLRDAWSTDYAVRFAEPGTANADYPTIKSVIDALANEALFQTEFLSDTRIGKPLGLATGGVPQPELEESGPSDNSLADLTASLHSIRNVYFGTRDGTPGKGLGRLVAAQSTATDREVRLAIDDALAAVALIPRPYRQALIDQRVEVTNAHAAVKALKQIFATEVIGTLGSTLKFNDNDGDEKLFEPVDAASVKTFRAVFGVLMLIAVARFFAHGWIDDYYVMPAHHFTYFGFDWVQPWPATGMYIHFAAMGVLAILIATGTWVRASCALFGVLFAYAHLIDKTNYLNHYYLIICIAFLMACMPLERGRATVPRWVLWALRAQIGLVYVFGGIAKLKTGWLVDAQPLKIWLSANTDFPVIGGMFEQAWVAHVFAIAGAAFDLAIVPLLLWRRTRVAAFVVLVAFHLVTARLFQLGMFPWVMMASSLIFFAPDWPRRWLRRPAPPTTTPYRPRRWVLALLGAYFAFHLVMPLRHWLYPGDVCWTEEGFRFAWNVMLIEKDGSVELHVREPATGRRWEVAPTAYLTRYQAKMMSTQPDMILQLAHIVADDFRARGVIDPEVRVDAFASLNGKPRARLVDPTVDLAKETDGLAPRTWIVRDPQPQRRAAVARRSP